MGACTRGNVSPVQHSAQRSIANLSGGCRYATAEIEQKVKEMRQKMLLEHAAMSDAQKLDSLKSRDDTHALAKRKEAELARFKQAFGVQGDEVRSSLKHVSCEHTCG